METVKLYSQDERTTGKTITLPLVGDKTFSNDENAIEVTKDQADQLALIDFGIKLIDNNIADSSEKSKAAFDETVQMLQALPVEDVDKFLAEYPRKETHKLQSAESKINFLAKKAAKNANANV